MWRFNGHADLIVRLALALSLAMLSMLVYIVWSQISHDLRTGVAYDEDTYMPQEQGPFCPGDVLHYDVRVIRDAVGPIEIVRNYCRVDTGLCVLDLSDVDYTTVYDLRPPASSPRTLPIPIHPRMTPGAWVYVHQIAIVNSDNWQTYVVPFEVAENCP